MKYLLIGGPRGGEEVEAGRPVHRTLRVTTIDRFDVRDRPPTDPALHRARSHVYFTTPHPNVLVHEDLVAVKAYVSVVLDPTTTRDRKVEQPEGDYLTVPYPWKDLMADLRDELLRQYPDVDRRTVREETEYEISNEGTRATVSALRIRPLIPTKENT